MNAADLGSGLRVRLREFSYPQARRPGPLLKDIGFTASTGAITAIMGGNGCGKTTLLRSICGLTPAAIDLELNGAPIAAPNPKIGIVFQDYRLFPWKTVEENIRCAADAVGASASAVSECIAEFSLQPLASAWPKTLSGGEQARVALARCLVQRPSILLLDEVFRSLDLRTHQGIREIIQRLTQKLSLVTIAVTHDVEEANQIADRALVLSGNPATVAHIIDRRTQSGSSLKAELMELLAGHA